MSTENTNDAPDFTAAMRSEYKLPESWTEEQVKLWVDALEQGVEQYSARLEGSEGEAPIFMFDPTRAERPVSEWPTAELLLALKGTLLDFDDKRAGDVVREHAKREPVEAAWSIQQHLDFHRQGIVPEKTSNGVWVKDVTRADRDAGSWTTAELEAWAMGEIKAIGKGSDQKLAYELKNRLKLASANNSPEAVKKAYRESTGAGNQQVKVTSEPVVMQEGNTPVDIMKKIPKVEGLSPMNVSMIDNSIVRYRDAVKPGKMIGENEGLQAQAGLETLFTYVVNLEGQALVAGMQRLKELVAQELKGVFDPSMAYRFTGGLRETIRERHINFIELLRVYASPNTGERKQVDVRYMLKGWPAEKVDMLVEYFTKIA